MGDLGLRQLCNIDSSDNCTRGFPLLAGAFTSIPLSSGFSRIRIFFLFYMAGGRKSKVAAPARPQNTLVLDNGAWTLKAGLVCGGSIPEPRVIPNCIARDRSKKIYVASELDKCRDFSEIQFRRPVEKGYLVNWEAQKEIWDQELFGDKAQFKCDPSETRLMLTEQPNALPVLQTNCDQIVFEEYGFSSYYRGLGMYSLNTLTAMRGRQSTTKC